MNHADDTCPHLVVLGLLEAENARLKAENARLKTEVHHLMVFCNCTLIPSKELQAQVERLTKAGDALGSALILFELKSEEERQERLKNWAIAKYGEPRA